MKADISIWDLIHTSSERREAFLRVFQAAHVSPTIEPAALETMVAMIAILQVISFSSDELPSVGINHNQLLFITVQYQTFLIRLTLVHNGQASMSVPCAQQADSDSKSRTLHQLQRE